MFIKKSLAHASAHYTPPSALSCRLTSNYKRNALDASFPLWETGVFACYFLWNSHELCRCRSPPHFSSPVNWTRESKWRYIMQKINLRELYPDIYKTDTYLEISDEVQAVFLADKRAEARYLRQVYNYKAHYSLDCDNGIEKAVVQHPLTPEEILEDKQLRDQLYAAVMELPDKQAKWIYARFYLGMTIKEIAKVEGVDLSWVYKSIKRGLKRLRKKVQKV